MKEKEDQAAPIPIPKKQQPLSRLRKKKVVYRPPVQVYKNKQQIMNAYEPQYDKSKLPPLRRAKPQTPLSFQKNQDIHNIENEFNCKSVDNTVRQVLHVNFGGESPVPANRGRTSRVKFCDNSRQSSIENVRKRADSTLSESNRSCRNSDSERFQEILLKNKQKIRDESVK